MKYILVVLMAFLGLINQAAAALPEGASTALATAQTDGVTMAGLVLGAIVAIFAIKLLRRGL